MQFVPTPAYNAGIAQPQYDRQQIVCRCQDSQKAQLLTRADGTDTMYCLTCDRLWHMCAVHGQIAVAGPGIPKRLARCSCHLQQRETNPGRLNNGSGPTQPANEPAAWAGQVGHPSQVDPTQALPVWCPLCRGTDITKPDYTTSTLLCRRCQQPFHMCYVHKTPVTGPSYPLQSVSSNRCQCKTTNFLQQDRWSQPFA